ncbi:AAA family ATPase [Pyruvatibacter sp.]|uniref:AAA family ATPase n=1 Tax=Pyruvatibacter sp. TaxID=1981328 RepID=UPI0032EB67F4
MRLRRFKAPSMRDAMALVRAEMGDTAIIVSSEELASGGVEVTAAVERRAPAPDTNPVRERLEDRLRARMQAEAAGAPTVDAAATFDISDIDTILADHRVPDALHDRIVRAATAHQGNDARYALAHAIDIAIGFQPVGDKLAGSIMLIGTPGAGKTVTAAKLAARAVLAGQQVDFITADAVRSGALAQSQAYADVLNQDVASVRGADELALMLDTRAELGRSRPCIIDTPATNLHDRAELDHTARLVQAARAARTAGAPGTTMPVEPVGVIAAGGDTEDMADAAQFFARLGCRRVIITRTDATPRLGGVLAALAASRLAAAEFGIKPYLAGGLAAATPHTLATMMIAKSTTSPPVPHLMPHRPSSPEHTPSFTEPTPA